MAKIYTVQPRFKVGDPAGGWSVVDGIFRMGLGSDGYTIPPYGTEVRDLYLSEAWRDEPMTAGAFSTWIEKAQTSEWKITGGRNNVRHYAGVLADADGGRGWTHHQGMVAGDYLWCDKGGFEELGRSSPKATVGRVLGIQHVDSTRLVKTGKLGAYWRYYPERGGR